MCHGNSGFTINWMPQGQFKINAIRPTVLLLPVDDGRVTLPPVLFCFV